MGLSGTTRSISCGSHSSQAPRYSQTSKIWPLRRDLAHRLENRVGTGPVRAVRIGHFPGHIDLSRFQPLQQGHNVGNVLRMDGGLGDGAGPVKTQVHELELLGRNAASQRRGAGFGLADQLLDLEQILGVGLARLLARAGNPARAR